MHTMYVILIAILVIIIIYVLCLRKKECILSSRKTNSKYISNLRELTEGEGYHITTTNYCGAGTNVENADLYGPTNALDKICMKHDHNYGDIVDKVNKDRASYTDLEIKQMVEIADNTMIEDIKNLKDKTTSSSLAMYAIKAKLMIETRMSKLLYNFVDE